MTAPIRLEFDLQSQIASLTRALLATREVIRRVEEWRAMTALDSDQDAMLLSALATNPVTPVSNAPVVLSTDKLNALSFCIETADYCTRVHPPTVYTSAKHNLVLARSALAVLTAVKEGK